ncbi:MAG: DUF177 domain-containing protein [Candidatus Kapaibacterium sp.]
MAKAGVKHHPAMVISISGLNDGEYPFSFDEPAAAIGLDDSFEGNVRVSGELRKVSTQFFLTGTIVARYARACDRCLTDVHREISIPVRLFYGHDLADDSRSGENDDVETRSIHAEQESIVLDEDVRQTILLNVPLKTLCSDGCLGICSGCGTDLNTGRCTCNHGGIDPRWAKLAEVFKKNEEE